MGWRVRVRAARPEDGAARRRLVRDGFRDHHWDAFLLFLFQEVTLQAALLAGAVLFIFCGVPAPACACALPAAAALVALGVRAAHAAAARRHALNIDKEMMGFVAEVCAPPPAAPAPAPAPAPAGLLPPHLTDEPYHKQVVGTVSVSEYWGPGHSGWLHALAVHPGWRRRGAGAALAGAARRAGAAAGLDTLEAVTSELQAAARSVLHAAGWSCRGSYRRPVLGRALGLRVAQLCVELPHA